MLRATLTLALFLGFQAAPALAQSADPVVQHYQAYEAALGRGDRAAVEAAAAAALAASEARDGDGGRTGVLAANLAQARLALGRGGDAIAPAQRALQIAEGNAASGVSPIYARLLLGQAELAVDPGQGRRRLSSALQEAGAAGNLNPEAYEAAIALGVWATRNNEAAAARDAYEQAIAFAAGDDDTSRASRALGLVGRGIALTMLEPPPTRRARSAGTRLGNAPRSDATEGFVEALRLSRAAAERDARTGRLTRAQTTYATALAWANDRAVLMRSLDWDDRMDLADRVGFAVPLGDGAASCRSELQTTPPPAYSAGDLRAVSGNVVVVRVTTNAAGAITDRRIVGAVGDGEFVRAVGAVVPQWEVETEACQGARVDFIPVLVTAADEVEIQLGGAVGQATPGPFGPPQIAQQPLNGRLSGSGGRASGRNDGVVARVIR